MAALNDIQSEATDIKWKKKKNRKNNRETRDSQSGTERTGGQAKPNKKLQYTEIHFDVTISDKFSAVS